MGQALAKKKAGKARKRGQQYEIPPQGDIGPDTHSQRKGAEIIEFRIGGARLIRKRRNHLLNRMLSRGSLERHHVVAGFELLDRWEATWRSPPPAWTRDFVDSSPRPGDVNVASLQAKAKYHELSQWIERDWRWLVQSVVFQEHPIRPILTKDPDKGKRYNAELRRQLGRLAVVLRLRRTA